MLNYVRLAECLNELLTETSSFDLNTPSSELYEGKIVKVLGWDGKYYDGGTGKGLLTFQIGDDIIYSTIEYDSWGDIQPNIHPDSLKVFSHHNEGQFQKQLDEWEVEDNEHWDRADEYWKTFKS